MHSDSPIDRFDGPYEFLSNFYRARPIMFKGQLFDTAEHAYQAAKFMSHYMTPEQRHAIKLVKSCRTPGRAKKAAHMMDGYFDPTFPARKLAVMREILEDKFKANDLRRSLCNTAGRDLIEGNDWGDVYWGVCKGLGQNELGKLLMSLRDKLCQA